MAPRGSPFLGTEDGTVQCQRVRSAPANGNVARPRSAADRDSRNVRAAASTAAASDPAPRAGRAPSAIPAAPTAATRSAAGRVSRRSSRSSFMSSLLPRFVLSARMPVAASREQARPGGEVSGYAAPMLFTRKATAMPTPEDALPGRDTPLLTPGRHLVLGTPIGPPFPEGTEQAIFGMGCFWGAERMFWRAPDIYTTAVGYSGGFTPNPTYQEVCTGRTG